MKQNVSVKRGLCITLTLKRKLGVDTVQVVLGCINSEEFLREIPFDSEGMGVGGVGLAEIGNSFWYDIQNALKVSNDCIIFHFISQ